MDDDVERAAAEIGLDALHHPVYAEIAGVLVAFVGPNVFRCVGERVERGIERIDLLELQQLSARQLSRFIHLPALEKIREDVEGRRPGSNGDASSGLGERFGDGEAKPRVIRDAGDERALAGEIDVQHYGDIVIRESIDKGKGFALRMTEAANTRTTYTGVVVVWESAQSRAAVTDARDRRARASPGYDQQEI